MIVPPSLISRGMPVGEWQERCAGGKVQGTFVEKLENCVECDFYKYVKS